MLANINYFEDFSPGMTFTSHGRTVTEADIVNFAGITGDWYPLHTDEEYASKTPPFYRRIAHGMLVLSIASGSIFIPLRLLIAFYGIDKLRFVNPAFIGDTIRTALTVQEIEKKDFGGLVTFEKNVLNQRNELVVKAIIKVLFRSKEDDN
ncbi:MAG: MaoC family dehydratase N-terminal domain-containing protein [Dethiobacter sp.]|jgi:acyl dehydratase|nr:MaoC family dehydratase N-terminal domain-containing protein [Dethiobacter sp.]